MTVSDHAPEVHAGEGGPRPRPSRSLAGVLGLFIRHAHPPPTRPAGAPPAATYEPAVVPAQKPADGAIVALAKTALMKLGAGAREAEAMIAAAGPCATTEVLVLEALRRWPMPA